MIKSKILKFFLFFLAIIFQQCTNAEKQNELVWPEIKAEYKPGTYWWWMGSAVDKKNLTYNLVYLNEIGIGNVHVIPIYGVEGEEDNYIDFLSPKWMETLEYTANEVSRLNMNVDMSTTTGWPFGGSHVSPEDAAKTLEYKKYSLTFGDTLNILVDAEKTVSAIAFSDKHQPVNIFNNIDSTGKLKWIPTKGEWDIYVLSSVGTGQKVKRAAPGNEGLVLDPFSKKALAKYLKRYDMAFNGFSNIKLRAQYHDSYEYYNANWTTDFLQEFNKRNNYDLLNYLPQLLNPKKIDVRILADYRRTLADLHLEYIQKWTDWAQSHGWITRNEAHGAPANLLDLYAASDIPETETFGARKSKIPGIRFNEEEISKSVPPNPLVLKFASSAANLSGKNLIASETCTWLRDHYKTTLAQIKPQIDELFISGTNHIFYHGNAYSPEDAPWPGWIFYASTHFEKENSIWEDFAELNKYVTRCQSLLQNSEPDIDILLYWPIEDIYHSFPDKLLKQLSVHDIEWFTKTEFGKLAQVLNDDGYCFDYISDKQIQNLKALDSKIVSHKNIFDVILIPQTEHIPIETLNKLKDLAEEGTTIIFQKSLPRDIPGFWNLDERKMIFKEIISDLELKSIRSSDLVLLENSRGKIHISDDVSNTLNILKIRKEEFTSKNLNFIRKKHNSGYLYFISNFSDKTIDSWIPLAVNAYSVGVLDPRYSDRTGIATSRNKNDHIEIYLQIQPGESFFLKTFTIPIKEKKNWYYTEKTGAPIELTGDWKIKFIKGGPELPPSINARNLKSWTIFNDTIATKFAGTGRYMLEFDLPEIQSDDWLLDLGTVCESAKLNINGHQIGTLWSQPFNILVGQYLKPGKNKLEVDVTNLSANRIRYLDLKGVNWKKFFFVNVKYEKFDASKWPIVDSGLLGPVNLIPINYIKK